jgi:hypothetical protein
MQRAWASVALPLWERASRSALAAYQRRLQAGTLANRSTLQAILRRNARTEFGRRHDFAAILRDRDVEGAWRRAVPVAGYAEFRDAIGRIADGAEDVLFAGRPRLFVSTSGTTGDPKLFPMTSRQQNEALRCIALLTPGARAHCVPGLGFRQPTATLLVASRGGQYTGAGIPVGNPSGAGLRRVLRVFAPPFWVFPPAVLEVADYPTALYLHALFALRAADLGCIEAIFASHVVSWMGLIGSRAPELLSDIAAGGASPSLSLTRAERDSLRPYLLPDPARAAAVERALGADQQGLMSRLWPGLKVISAVQSGAFAVSTPRLRMLAGAGPAFYTTCFGATEGMVGMNLWLDRPEQYALALGAAHFEFLPVGDGDAPAADCVGFDDLPAGRSFEVVLTTHAGLYRYRLGDVVRIAGREGSTPVFEFDHRRGNVVDLVGEKTTEQHLRRAIRRLPQRATGDNPRLVDYALAPDTDVVPYRYVIYAELDSPRPPPAAELRTLAGQLDEAFGDENPGYRTLARANGRLAGLSLRLVRPGTFDALLQQQRAAHAAVNANQVKVPRVLRTPGQRSALESAVVARSD